MLAEDEGGLHDRVDQYSGQDDQDDVVLSDTCEGEGQGRDGEDHACHGPYEIVVGPAPGERGDGRAGRTDEGEDADPDGGIVEVRAREDVRNSGPEGAESGEHGRLVEASAQQRRGGCAPVGRWSAAPVAYGMVIVGVCCGRAARRARASRAIKTAEPR